MGEMSNRRRVQWVRPDRSHRSALRVDEAVGAAEAANTVERAAAAYGLPSVPDAASAEDEAVILSEIAAEAEHGLMVQYLYGAFSTKDSAVSRNLRRTAIEEMGHLLTVQNLRLALGGECYLRRQDESPQPEFDPYPFKLEPMTSDALAKYVAAEAPDEEALSAEERNELAIISTRAGLAAGVPLIHRVALIYMRLFYLFQDGDEAQAPWPQAAVAADWGRRWHVAPASLLAESQARQCTVDEWAIGDPETEFLGFGVGSLANCREAIHAVAAQGEGSAAATNSHFARFRDVYRQAVASALPLHAVPVIGIDAVDAEPAATLSRLFDLRYELLLINLHQIFVHPQDGDHSELRGNIIDWCRREMRLVLAPLHRHLALRPRRPGGSVELAAAAPAYRMPASAVPVDKATLWSRLRTTLAIGDALVAEVRAQGVTAGFLNVMAELDELRRQALPSA
jgi:rubrerythrin